MPAQRVCNGYQSRELRLRHRYCLWGFFKSDPAGKQVVIQTYDGEALLESLSAGGGGTAAISVSWKTLWSPDAKRSWRSCRRLTSWPQPPGHTLLTCGHARRCSLRSQLVPLIPPDTVHRVPLSRKKSVRCYQSMLKLATANKTLNV